MQHRFMVTQRLFGQGDKGCQSIASIQLADSGDTWSVAIVGKNLTDEETTTWGNDVPLGGQGFDGTYFQHIDALRSFEIQAKYRF